MEERERLGIICLYWLFIVMTRWTTGADNPLLWWKLIILEHDSREIAFVTLFFKNDGYLVVISASNGSATFSDDFPT